MELERTDSDRPVAPKPPRDTVPTERESEAPRLTIGGRVVVEVRAKPAEGTCARLVAAVAVAAEAVSPDVEPRPNQDDPDEEERPVEAQNEEPVRVV